MKNRVWTEILVMGIVFISGFQPAALANDAGMMALVQDLQKQMVQMQNTIDLQSKKIAALEKDKIRLAEPAADFKENLEAPVAPAHKWLKGLDFYGDFRLRYEARDERENSAVNDRNRFRYRLRLGMDKTFSDELKVGWRLVSAAVNSITSTNTTLDTGFGYKPISIDTAYATYTPNWAKAGPVKEAEITAGKFKNPFEEGSSIMIWDRDVRPEGVYEKAVLDLVKTENFDLDYSILAGQLIVEEGGGSDHDDAELMAVQTGFKTKIDIGKDKPVATKHLFSWYNYNDYTLPGNFPATGGNPTSDRFGPAFLAATSFDIVEIYNEVWVPMPWVNGVKAFFDYATNVNEGADISRAPDQNDSWGLGFKVGKAKNKGTWEASYGYYNIEANSVPGAFNDSDFGFSDQRGSVIKGAYAITDRLALKVAAFITDNVSADALTDDAPTNLYQVDLVWKI